MEDSFPRAVTERPAAMAAGATDARSAGEVTRARLRGVVFVSLFTALLVLPPVGHHLIVKSDEARYALLARDMLERRAWLDAQVEGERYRNKPPLFPWSIAAISALRGGVTEATAQLPSALAAIVSVAFTFLLGDRLFGRRAGFWSALILATSASFFSHSQQILPDMLVVAFAAAASYAFVCAMARPSAHLAMVGFYAALAFAVFAKGPVGFLPALVALVWLLTEHGARCAMRLWHPLGLAVFALITLAWLGPFLAAGTQTFGENVLWQDWIATYLGLPLPRRVLSYALDALVGFLPWTPVLVIALYWAVRDRADGAVRFALLSFVVPFLMIIFSHSRLPRYLMPVYPGAALVVGWWADAHGGSRSLLGRVLGWASLIGVAGALLALPWIPDARESGLTLEIDVLWKALPLLVAVILVAVVFLIGLTRSRPVLLVYGGVALMSLGLGYGAWLFNGITDRREDFRQLYVTLARHAPGGDLRVFTQAKLLPLDFYAGRELPRLTTVDEFKKYIGSSARPTVLIDRQDLRVVPAELLAEVRLLESLSIHEQRLYVLGCNGAERGAGSARCASAGPLDGTKK